MSEANDADGSGPVGPIIFGVEEARDFLLNHGHVYTFRATERTTGDTWARKTRTAPKLADVTVEHVVSIPAPVQHDLRQYAHASGFVHSERWWQAIQEVHGEDLQVGHIYHVSLRGSDS